MAVYYFDSGAVCIQRHAATRCLGRRVGLCTRHVRRAPFVDSMRIRCRPAASLLIAASLAQRYPLKAYDAVQVSLALHANALLNADGLSLTLVSGDDQLLQAARAEGLAADNAFAHTP